MPRHLGRHVSLMAMGDQAVPLLLILLLRRTITTDVARRFSILALGHIMISMDTVPCQTVEVRPCTHPSLPCCPRHDRRA